MLPVELLLASMDLIMKARLLKRLCALGLVAICWTASVWCAPFQLVSQRGANPAPAGGAGDSWGAIMSPDGRFVLFASTANNLVSTTNGQALPISGAPRLNVFLRDRTNGTTTLVSANLSGTGGGNGHSIPTSLSTNGQFACFESGASDLIAGDTNGVADVFVRDLLNNTTMLVSTSTNGGVGNGVCRGSVMTPDGRFVAFVSSASTLVPNDTNNIADVFVRDLQSNVTTLVSVGAQSTNLLPLSSSESPEITPDGRYVAFYSSATNLVPGVTNGGEVYVRDLLAGTIVWVSANSHSLLGAGAFSYNHAISTDGHYVAFEASSNAPPTTASRSGYILRYSMASGTTDIVSTNAFVPPSPAEEINNLDISPDGRFIAFVGNTNGTSGTTSAIFRWDAQSATTLLISADMSGNVAGESICDSPKIDPTGRYIAFLSSASNLVTNALIPGYHLYLRDATSNITTLLDLDTNGFGSSVSPATVPRMNEDNSLAAFDSLDANLVANDRNHNYDLFVRNISAGSNELISAHAASLASISANGPSMVSLHGVFPGGWRILFSSEADNLIENDTNAFRDVFIRDRISGTNILVSAATNGLPADGLSFEPVLSADGRFVAFTSSADNLVPNDTNRATDVFVRDLLTGTTTLASVNTSGTASGNKASSAPAIGTGGRYVAFRSLASNLASGQGIGSENLFVRDMQSNVTYALTTNGVQSFGTTPDGHFIVFSGKNPGSIIVWDAQTATTVYSNAASVSPVSTTALSADGNHIIYGNGLSSFVIDRAAQTSQQLAVTAPTSHPGLRFSSDGRYVVYSRATNDHSVINATNQVYIYDFRTGVSSLVSQNPSAAPGNGTSDSPDISSDGRFIVYRSFATDIASLAATNGMPNLYLYDRAANSNALLTAGLYPTLPADNRSRTPLFSDDGRTLVFESAASNLSPGDFNSSADVFVLSLLYATVSVTLEGPTITWPTQPGETYHVQFKDSLSDANWQEVSGVITFTGEQAQLTDLAPYNGQRFYRIAAN
jgi:hypothetical protein